MAHGTRCLRLSYPLPSSTGQAQTCFQVAGVVGQLPQLMPPWGSIAVYTDRTDYRVGDPIQVCYRVPAPGRVTIIDMLANGQTQPFLSGYDDGTGGCQGGTITPPAGSECLTITYTYANGAHASAQTCFRVTSATPMPPSGWTALSSATVDASGNWQLTQQAPLDPGLTYIRITNGSCAADPAASLVWEATTQRLATSSRVTIWAGELEPLGAAAGSRKAGTAVLAWPVTANPATHVELTLFDIGGGSAAAEAHAGFLGSTWIEHNATLYACVRAP